ncbi:ABC transporter substrate-binding protein [Blautia argi]|uniref:Probable sugar-binding periplasmic protein n=1 Tax=Blautia argi TaxID=1912897 RepID=A0A2Z4UDW0_9FIRM|nr:extracellular solute-binding protein [Blautia argi]AWY99211.1 carbohydrate ABC transporter substrate-binding protein [Blautia argi]
MKGKKLTALAITAVMGMSVLAGCSGGSAESGKETKKTADGKTELELFSTKAENKETLQKLVDTYNDSQDKVKVTLTQPADAGTVLKTRMTKNDLPDMVAMGGDFNYAELQSAGVLTDLSGEAFLDNINESYMEMLYALNKDQEEKSYGVPYATNASGIIYNKDIFAENSIEIPTTFSELLAACEKLQAAGVTPFELTFKDAWTILPAWNAMAPVMQPENFYTDRKEGKTTFEGTHEAVLENYLKLVPYAQKDYMGTSYDDGNKKFAAGEAAMMMNGNWAITEIKKANADVNLDMFKFPSTDDAEANKVTSGVDVLLGITTNCGDEEGAKDFINFMVQKENAQLYAEEQFAFSAVKGVEQNDPSVAGVKADIEAGNVVDFPDHYYPSGYDLSAALSNFFLEKGNGKDDAKNIADTLKKLDTDYDTLNVN